MKSSASLSAYTPSNMSVEMLEKLFVQREHLLQTLVGRLNRSVTSGERYHVLLVGPRGCGKTHFVSLAESRLTELNQEEDPLRFAWLGEDDVFSTLVHLAIGIVTELSERYPDEFSTEILSAVRGQPPQDAADAILHDVINRLQNRSLLLITENLDLTFQAMGDTGRKQWRAFLQETRKISTLATTQQLFDGVSSRKEAFYGFFDIHHLEPLRVEDARALMIRISDLQNDKALRKYLQSPEGLYRMRALHYLAGGNHRMYVLLAEFLNRESLESLVTAFESLAESMTPYFQERMRSLPDQQRQLVQYLCDAEGGKTVKDIAGDTFIEERSCSKQLGLLKRKGYVRSGRRGKDSYYEMTEPLMRLCLEAKNQRGRPLALLARFLRAWFRPEQLEVLDGSGSTRLDSYRKLALATGDNFRAEIARDLQLEIENCRHTGQEEQIQNLRATLEYAQLPQAGHENDQVTGKAQKLYALTLEAFQRGEFQTVITTLTDLVHLPTASIDEIAKALVSRGVVYGRLEETEKAIEDYSAVITLKDSPIEQIAKALFNRGVVYSKLGETDKEIEDYSAVITLKDAPTEQIAIALVNRGVVYGGLGEADKAIEDYSEVISLKDAPPYQIAKALIYRGVVYGGIGETDKKIEDYSAVITFQDASTDQIAKAQFNRGVVYGDLGETDKAIEDYSAVITLKDAPTDQIAKALVNRGVVYGDLGKTDKEIEDYSAVITLKDAPTEQVAKALFNRGLVYLLLKETNKAIEDYSAVISLEGASKGIVMRALFQSAELHILGGSQADAERALEKAFRHGDPSQNHFGGWPEYLLAKVLHRPSTEWSTYAAMIARLYDENGCGENLGTGLMHSISILDRGDYSRAQLESWLQAWTDAGETYESLSLSVRALNAATRVLLTDPPNDRPLFDLPLELRKLVRPMLDTTLGPSKDEE